MTTLSKKLLEKYKNEEKESKVAGIIKELQSVNFGGSNEEQMKGVQLLKGLAASDDPAANAFMKKLSGLIGSSKNESIDEKLSGGKLFRTVDYGNGYRVLIFDKDDKAYAMFSGFAEKELNGYFEPKNQNRWWPEITDELRRRMEKTGPGDHKWDSSRMKVKDK